MNISKPYVVQYVHFSLVDKYFKWYTVALKLDYLEQKSMLITFPQSERINGGFWDHLAMYPALMS